MRPHTHAQRRGLGFAAVAVCLLSLLNAASAFAAESRPNFVVILCDDLGYGDLGCYGHPAIRTPNLDQLAKDGVRFTDCYASAPVCSPSRSGMLTGRTPGRCGIYDWIPAGSPMHLRRSEITVATLLKKAGYATCFVGKWHCNGMFNSPKQPQPSDHGFDYWFATQNNAGPSHENPTNFVRNGQRVGPTNGYSSTVIVEEAITWLAGRDASKPFCLFVWFHTPHEPVATAESFVEQYRDVRPREKAIYYGNVAQMDYEVGRLLKRLDESSIRDNTFVFFTSDNGPETLKRYPTGNHSYGSPGPLRGMKLHLHEGGIRVPGIIRWPGKARAGLVSGEPIINTDVLPTFCDITGIPVPKDRPIDGTSLLPVFDNQPIKRKTPLFWWYPLAISSPKVAARDGNWKILADENLSRFELYNLREDRAEARDLAAAHPERVRSIARVLEPLFQQVRREGPHWPPSRPTSRSQSRE